jgi:hypothetical protein
VGGVVVVGGPRGGYTHAVVKYNKDGHIYHSNADSGAPYLDTTGLFWVGGSAVGVAWEVGSKAKRRSSSSGYWCL